MISLYSKGGFGPLVARGLHPSPGLLGPVWNSKREYPGAGRLYIKSQPRFQPLTAFQRYPSTDKGCFDGGRPVWVKEEGVRGSDPESLVCVLDTCVPSVTMSGATFKAPSTGRKRLPIEIARRGALPQRTAGSRHRMPPVSRQARWRNVDKSESKGHQWVIHEILNVRYSCF